MIIEDRIIEYFSVNLIKRDLKFTIREILTEEDNLIISEIGLPNDVLNFRFANEISLLSNSEAIIGNTSYDSNVILNLKSKNIIKDNENCFLAKSLKHLVLQLYVYDIYGKVLFLIMILVLIEKIVIIKNMQIF